MGFAMDADLPLKAVFDAPPIALSARPRAITFQRSHFYLALLPIAFLLGLTAGYVLRGAQASASLTRAASAKEPVQVSGEEQAQVSSQAGRGITRYPVPVDDDPALGPADAPVTIIEFGDYECPYCRRWHAVTYRQVLEAYPGQIRFVYRDFPIESIHADAQSAAVAANCAGEQGEYWAYHDLLFTAPSLSPELYLSLAEDLKLDLTAFARCQQDESVLAEVSADHRYAASHGVRSTPTFFINGIALLGAQPFEVFKEIIDMELAGK